LRVNGSLDLENTPITSLPDNLTVNGYLNLSNTKITSLPDNLRVNGSLDLENTKITSLPDNLRVKGNLYLNNTKITSLPDNLTVNRDLDLRNTKITSLPDNLRVEGKIIGFGADVHAENDSALRLAKKNEHEGTIEVLEDWIAKEKGLKESINNKSILEFQRGLEPKAAMNIGTKQQMINELEKEGIKPYMYTIDNDMTIKITSWISRHDNYKAFNIMLKYVSQPIAKLITSILTFKNGDDEKKIIDEALKDKLSPAKIEKLIKQFGNNSEIAGKFKIYLAKKTRKKEKAYLEDELTSLYAFIGFTEKVPVLVNGKKYYEDKLGTESIIKINKYDPLDLNSVGMMKVRARFQYPDGNVYIVYVPKDMMDEELYEKIPEKYYDFIDKNKQKI
jgi:hypothetical protein